MYYSTTYGIIFFLLFINSFQMKVILKYFNQVDQNWKWKCHWMPNVIIMCLLFQFPCCIYYWNLFWKLKPHFHINILVDTLSWTGSSSFYPGIHYKENSLCCKPFLNTKLVGVWFHLKENTQSVVHELRIVSNLH